MAINVKKACGIFIYLVFSAGCDSSDGIPNLGGVYTDLAREEDPDRNPVIVIPGVLGSTLVDAKSGNIAWGEIGHGLENPKKDKEIRRIALSMEAGKRFENLRDDVVAEQALEKIVITMYGVTVEVNTCADILATPGAGGFRSEIKSRIKPVDINYAVHLPVIDILFGTFFLPRHKWPESYGIRNETVPRGILKQQLYPFAT